MTDGARQGDPDDAAQQLSLIGGGISITGNIEATVDLDLKGKVVGDVRCATLILGEEAEIRGSIFAERVRASGLIEGSVETKDLAVEAGARIKGDVIYSRIRIANGGIVDGQLTCRLADEEAEAARLRLVDPPSPSRRKPGETVHIE